MFFRQLLNDETACASYLLGCKSRGAFAVVDPHVDLIDDYVLLAEAQGVPIVAVLETHVQADHVSGLPALVERTGATAYVPAGSGVEFTHHPLADGEVVTLGNTEIQALSTPGHAAAHHAYVVTDHARADESITEAHGIAIDINDHNIRQQVSDLVGRNVAAPRQLAAALVALVLPIAVQPMDARRGDLGQIQRDGRLGHFRLGSCSADRG